MEQKQVPELILAGNWFVAGTSAAIAARLIVPDPGLPHARLETGEEDSTDVHIASVSDRIGTIDRRLEMQGGGLFVTPDNAGVDRLSFHKGGWFSNMAGLEAFRPRLLAFLAAAVALIVAGIIYGLPVLAKVAAWATPPQVVVWMDESTLSTLDRLAFSKSRLTPNQKFEFTEGFAELVSKSGHEGRLELMFRDGGAIGPNALALPAGTIVLTDQLARLGNRDEILAVLAHEIAHVQHEHSLQQLYRALGFAGLVGIIAGDMGAVGEEILSGGGVMVAMAASREMETEADLEAVALLRKVDIAPENLVTMLDKLYAAVCGKGSKDCEESGWFSSHPGGAERREALRQQIAATQ